MTPGATTSMRFVAFALIGPLPSSGRPSGSTTRPTSSGPAGVSMIRPVVRTSSPSLISSYSPRMIAETVSSSRLNARPKVSRPKSRSSDALQPARPWIRAMPSPISTTVPTSTDSAFDSNRWICALMMSVISDAVPAIVPLLRRELSRQLIELSPKRDVHQTVADLDLRAADEALVHREGRAYLLAACPLEPANDVGSLRLVHRDRRRDFGLHDALPPVDKIAVRPRDLRQQLN